MVTLNPMEKAFIATLFNSWEKGGFHEDIVQYAFTIHPCSEIGGRTTMAVMDSVDEMTLVTEGGNARRIKAVHCVEVPCKDDLVAKELLL